MISLQKTSSCLLENNTRLLGNNEADVNNQMSRKYKEENITSFLKRFNSLVALMRDLPYNLWHFEISSATGEGGFFGRDPENKVTVDGLI